MLKPKLFLHGISTLSTSPFPSPLQNKGGGGEGNAREQMGRQGKWEGRKKGGRKERKEWEEEGGKERRKKEREG